MLVWAINSCGQLVCGMLLNRVGSWLVLKTRYFLNIKLKKETDLVYVVSLLSCKSAQ